MTKLEVRSSPLRFAPDHRWPLLVAQCLDRIETSGTVGGQECKDAANQKRADTDDRDVARNNFGWQLRELVDLFRKHFDMRGLGQPTAEFISVTHKSHPKSQSHQGAE